MSQPQKSSGVVSGTLTTVGVFFGIASLLNYYDVFAHQGIYAVLDELIAKYREVLHGVFGFLDAPLEALAKSVAGLFQFDLHLQPYWKDVFVPIGLYFANAARATHGDGRTVYRRALILLGIVVALVTSIALASLGEALSLAPAMTALTAGVVLYEVISYVLLLTLVRPDLRASSPGFLRYAVERPLLSAALGFLAYLTCSFVFAGSENAAAFALIFFILLLGLRNIALAVYFALEDIGGWGGTFRDRLFRSRSWRLGAFVVVTIIVATLGVAWGG